MIFFALYSYLKRSKKGGSKKECEREIAFSLSLSIYLSLSLSFSPREGGFFSYFSLIAKAAHRVWSLYSAGWLIAICFSNISVLQCLCCSVGKTVTNQKAIETERNRESRITWYFQNVRILYAFKFVICWEKKNVPRCTGFRCAESHDGSGQQRRRKSSPRGVSTD
jgi:hypothetical protein